MPKIIWGKPKSNSYSDGWYGAVVEKASHTGRGRRVELRHYHGTPYVSGSNLILVVKPEPGWDTHPTAHKQSYNKIVATDACCKLSANGPLYFNLEFLKEMEEVITEAQLKLQGLLEDVGGLEL